VCTLIILNEHHDDWPLIIAANRDEFYDRPSAGPDLFDTLPLAIIAPKDLERGGTWMGATQTGWFVGLTNQDDGDHREGMESRGQVVADCLRLSGHKEIARYLIGLNPEKYNPFNLVFGRPGAMFLSKVHRGTEVDMEIIPQGITVISNDCSDARAYQRKVNHALVLAGSVEFDDPLDEVVRKLHLVLSDHSHSYPNPYQSLCVHDTERGFGTRSSAVVAVSKEGDVRYYHSEGPACQVDTIPLVRELMTLDLSDLEEPTELTDDDIEVIG
jgi:uncharacterized protein with NRDE domain